MEPQMERSKFFFAYSETQCILLKINIFETFLLEQKCYRLLTRRQNHPAAKHMNIFKDEGRLTPEFDIETSSGAGYLSSEMEMSLICLLKMLAAACKILLSSHIWATLLKSWTVAECMSAFMCVAAPIASGVEMTLLLIRFDTPRPCVVVLLSNHQNVFLISDVVLCATFLSIRGQKFRKKVLAVGLKWISFCESSLIVEMRDWNKISFSDVRLVFTVVLNSLE